MAILATGIAGSGHAGEKLGFFRLVSYRAEHQSGDGIFAIIFMIRPWFMFTVGDGSLVGKIAEKSGGTSDGLVDFRMIDAAIFRQHDGEIGREPGHIHGAIGRHRAVEFSVLGECGKAVAKGAIHTLTAGQRESDIIDGRQHLLVARDQEILAEKNISIRQLPCVAPDRSIRLLVWVHLQSG